MLRKPGVIEPLSFPKCILEDEHQFTEPKRAMFQENQMNEWKNSEAYQEYFGFVKAMNAAVTGKSLKVQGNISVVTDNLLKLLQRLEEILQNTPPIEQPQRFGNKAFKTWYEQVKKESEMLLEEALPEKYRRAVAELSSYFVESFGNCTRIDYGTGHEMCFCMFLYCLFRIGALKEEDAVATVNCIFNRYLQLVRKLQTTYRMEPAGSHGVWSLDDYQFVPFIWGSAQFIRNPIIEPSQFVETEVVEKYGDEYMFLGCIKYINTVKSGHFSEHSNQLWNISSLPSWNKINDGLLKMYKGEVLDKFPVVQHVLFGSLLRFVPFALKHTDSGDKRNPDFKTPTA